MALNWLGVCHPQAAMTPWDELERSLNGLSHRLRDMDSHYGDVFSQFRALAPSSAATDPTSGRGSRLLARPPAAWDVERLIGNAVVTQKDGSRKFRLQYDVRNFRPEDIKVKTVDNRLEVTAKCEEGDARHRMYREYRRSCVLPPGLDVEQLQSVYTPDGVLAIEAPMPAIEPSTLMRVARKATEPVPIAIEHAKAAGELRQQERSL